MALAQGAEEQASQQCIRRHINSEVRQRQCGHTPKPEKKPYRAGRMDLLGASCDRHHVVCRLVTQLGAAFTVEAINTRRYKDSLNIS